MEPIARESARDSMIRHSNSHACICETLRTVYDLIHEMPAGDVKTMMTERLLDAFIMAKKMQNRLRYYGETYKDKTGNNAKNLLFIDGTMALRKMRQKRNTG